MQFIANHSSDPMGKKHSEQAVGDNGSADEVK